MLEASLTASLLLFSVKWLRLCCDYSVSRNLIYSFSIYIKFVAFRLTM